MRHVSPRCGLWRQRLLSTTALVGLTLAAGGARAQLSPNARPTGGTVVGGAASIAATPSSTVVQQSTNRAAIDWQSFNVGSAQSVQFRQPSSSAVVLNRVTGPDPSAIAGRIDANGQVVITNPSGVVFSRGSQVNAQSLVVSAPGITNRNFMAGRMVFDQQPSPNAQIVNEGTITVRQAGLAAMVAPAVANRGVINARLGRVVLAGARTETLDLYGDGLVSLDVSSQVRQLPVGRTGQTVDALVTNAGTIVADGGTVELTAAAADGVIQKIVDARGLIRAASVGARTGQIALNGVGGSVVIDGAVEANGEGQAGTIAIGTNLTRALGSGTFPAGTSESVVVTPRARVTASAGQRGHGGRVTVLSTASTVIAGVVQARGGALSGNGGTIELSGEHGFALTAPADTSAPHGALGVIILDPTDLTIVPNSGTTTLPPASGVNPNIGYGDGTGPATVREADIEALEGNIHLQALDNLVVEAPLSLGTRTLLLEAGNNLTVQSTSTISASNIGLVAAAADIPGFNAAGSLTVAGTLLAGAGSVEASTGTIALTGGTGGIILTGSLQTATGAVLGIDTTGTFVESGPSATIIAADLEGRAGGVELLSATNQIGSIGALGLGFDVTGTAGNFELEDSSPLSLGGEFTPGPVVTVQNGNRITLIDDRITQAALVPGTVDALLVAPGGTITIAPFTPGTAITVTTADAVSGLGLTLTELQRSTADVLALGTLDASGHPTAGNVTFDGSLDLGSLGYGTLAIEASGALTQNAALGVGVLTGQAGSASLANSGNYIGTLDGFITTAGSLSLHTNEVLYVTGPLNAQDGTGTIDLSSSATLDADVARARAEESPGDIPGMVIEANIDAGWLRLDSTNGPVLDSQAILQTAGTITAGTLTGAGFSATLADANVIGTLTDFTTAGSLVLNDTRALVIDGAIDVGGTLDLSAPGITQSGGSIDAIELDGSASAPVSLTMAGNTIDAIGAFDLTGGAALSLVTASPTLFFTGPITGTASAISFTADFVSNEGGSIVDPGGTVSFAPFTTGTEVALVQTASEGETGLILDQGFVDTISTGTLALSTTGSITIGNRDDAIDLDADATVLALSAGGAITEGPAAGLTVGTLDASGTAITFDGNNVISTLGSIASAGDFTLANGNPTLSTSLAIDGPVTAGAAIDITNGGVVTLAGTVAAPSVTLTSYSTETVSASGTIDDFDADILQTGGTVSADSLALDAGFIQQTGGTIIAGTLSGSGAGVELLGANTIGTLGNFDAGGYVVELSGEAPGDFFELNDTGTLAVTGTLSYPQVAGEQSAFTLTATSILVEGPVTAGTLVLNAGSVTEPGGTIAVGTLGGTGGVFELTGSNTIDLVSGVTAGVFDLDDNTSVTLSGLSLDSGLIASAGSITLGGNVSATSLLLSAAGIGQTTAGVLDAGTLSLQGASTADLPGAANAIATLDGVNVGTLVLADSTALVLDGTLVATDLDLAVGGALTSATGWTPSVGTLTGTFASADLAVPTAASGIGTLDAITSPGGFVLTQGDGAPLFVAGTVTGSSITLQSGSLVVAGAILASGTPRGPVELAGTDGLTIAGTVAGGTVTLDGATITETGSIAAVVLTGSASGLVDLTAPGNAIGTLGFFSAGGGFDLEALTAHLTLAGTVVAPTIALSAASIVGPGALDGDVEVAADEVSLTGPNNIPTFDLLGRATSVVVDDRVALTVAGTLQAATLDLTSLVSIGQATGALLDVGTLAASAPTIALNGSNNVSVLGPVTAGTFLLSDDEALTVAGAVTATSAISITSLGSVTLAGDIGAPSVTIAADDGLDQTGGLVSGTAITLTSVGPLTLGGIVDAGSSGSLSLASNAVGDGIGGAILQSGGTIIAGTLTGNSDGPVTLNEAANAIGTIGGFFSDGGFQLTDTGTLTVAGLDDPLAVTLNAGSILAAGPLITGALALNAPGGVTETATGTLQASTLTGTGGAFALDAGVNTIGTLGAIDSTGPFALNEPGTLAIAGGVTATSVALTGLAALDEVAGGALHTGSLGGAVAGDASLTGANTIAALAAFSAGTLALTDTGGLVITGPVTAGAATLAVTGAVTQTAAGTLHVANLSGSAGSLTLDAANSIDTLGSFTAPGGLTIDDAQPLTVSGVVSASAIAIVSDSVDFLAGSALEAPGGTVQLAAFDPAANFTLAAASPLGIAPVVADTLVLGRLGGGPITITGTFDLSAIPILDLLSGGTIAEVGGALAAATLDATGAAIDLGGANRITAVGSLTSAGNLTLADDTGLSIVGPVSAAGTLTLLDTGAVTETGDGTVSAALLTGSAASLGLAATGNTIAALGPFTAMGSIVLADAESLDVTGALDPPDITLSADGNLTLDNTVTGAAVSLTAAGTIAEGPAGHVTASILDASAQQIDLTRSNAIAALGTISAKTAMTLADTGDLDFAGPISASTLDLTATGSIATTTGTFTAGLLTGRADGSAAFAGAIGTLDGFTAGSTLTVAAATPLVVTGTIAAPYLAITAPGTLTVVGGTIRTNGLPPAAQSGASPSPPGSFLQASAGADGTGTFDQLGTTTVTADGPGPSTLRIGIPAAGGTLTLAGLDAPDTTLILQPGRGSATGTIDVGALLVLDEGGSADLSGTVASTGGIDAAALAQIQPSPDLLYELNGCEIGISCGATTIPPISPTTPPTSIVPPSIPSALTFQPFSISLLSPEIIQGSLLESTADTERRRRSEKRPLLTLDTLDLVVGGDDNDAAIALPNISDRDY